MSIKSSASLRNHSVQLKNIQIQNLSTTRSTLEGRTLRRILLRRRIPSHISWVPNVSPTLIPQIFPKIRIKAIYAYSDISQHHRVAHVLILRK